MSLSANAVDWPIGKHASFMLLGLTASGHFGGCQAVLWTPAG